MGNLIARFIITASLSGFLCMPLALAGNSSQSNTILNKQNLSKSEINTLTKTADIELLERELFFQKFIQASATYKLLYDEKFIQLLLDTANKSNISSKCIFENIDFAKVKSEKFRTISDDLYSKYPAQIDKWNDDLNLLISINNFYSGHPTYVEFNFNKIDESPALDLLNEDERHKFLALMQSSSDFPLLVSLGYSGTVDNSIFNPEVINYGIIYNEVLNVEDKCLN